MLQHMDYFWVYICIVSLHVLEGFVSLSDVLALLPYVRETYAPFFRDNGGSLVCMCWRKRPTNMFGTYKAKENAKTAIYNMF